MCSVCALCIRSIACWIGRTNPSYGESSKKKLFFFLSFLFLRGEEEKERHIQNLGGTFKCCGCARFERAWIFHMHLYLYKEDKIASALFFWTLYIQHVCPLYVTLLYFKCVVFVFFSHTNKFRRLFLRSPSSGESQGFTFVYIWLWESFLYLSSKYHSSKYAAQEYILQRT